MEKTLTDCLETNVSKVEGVSVLLVLMAADPQIIGSLPNAGSAFNLLGSVLEDVYDDLNKHLKMELSRNRQKENDDAQDNDLL